MTNPNEFEKPCIIHLKECGMFCPICCQFICRKCSDIHISTGQILHGSQIEQIGREFELPSMPAPFIQKSKQVLEELYHKTLLLLSTNFNSMMSQINLMLTGPKELIKTKHLSTKAISILRQIKFPQTNKNQLIKDQNQRIRLMTREFNEISNIINNCWIPNSSKMSIKETIVKTIQSKTYTHIGIVDIKRSNMEFEFKSIKRKANLSSIKKLPCFNVNEHPHIAIMKDNFITLFNTFAKWKTPIMQLSSINSSASLVFYGSRIFTSGGFDTIREVHEIDLLNKKVIEKHKMNQGRQAHSLISKDGYIYAIGGRYQGNTLVLSKCERYKVDYEWEPIPNLYNARFSAASFIIDNYIYVFGGSTKGDCNGLHLNVMERLNTTNCSMWEMVSIDNQAEVVQIRDIIATVMENRVLICGGCTSGGYLNKYIFI